MFLRKLAVPRPSKKLIMSEDDIDPLLFIVENTDWTSICYTISILSSS